MADAENPADGEEVAPKKKSKRGLMIGLVLALVMGGAGFYAAQSGLIPGMSDSGSHAGEPENDPLALAPIAFVPIDPLVISLGPHSASQHLRFRAQLEVDPQYETDVAAVIPRVLDVLNTYLRAVEISDIENPAALVSLRAQMLRRIQMVAGEGRVNDLLIMEFVLN